MIKKKYTYSLSRHTFILLPPEVTRGRILGVGSILVAILPSCQDMKTIALQLQALVSMIVQGSIIALILSSL